jgi:hypothetical protein
MAYISVKEDHGRKEFNIDVPRFAKELATALGTGNVVKPHNPDYPTENQDIILAGQNLRLHISGYRYAHHIEKATVTISVSPTDVPFGERNQYDQTHNTTSATISPDKRDIFAIARDVQKRVIDANATQIAKQREYAKGRADNRLSLECAMGELQTMVPKMSVKMADDKLTAGWSFSAKNYKVMISGRLYPNGRISIDHVSSVNMTGLKTIIGALMTDGVE